MVLSTITGIVGYELLAKELKEPTKKVFGWLLNKGKEEYHEYKLNEALNNISEKITNVAKVKTIYKGDDSIDLHKFYVATKIEQNEKTINIVKDINDNNIVLQGTVGQGKSIFMRFLTYQEARHGQRIPLFYELRRLDEEQTLTAALTQQIKNWIAEFENKNFEIVAKTGNLVLFLDGFDEVPHSKVTRLLNEIEGWCERYPKMQVVISARPEADIQRSNYFKVIKLSEYTLTEQTLLIDKLVEETESKELLKKSINNSHTEIKELLKTPLMVTLFVMHYRSNLEIPSNQYEFYQDLFSVLISRHDKTKPGYERELNSNLSKKQLQKIFEQFCFISFNKDKLVFGNTEVIEIIEKCLDKQNFEADSDKVLKDLSQVVCLLQKDGMEYSFIHKSIQEYFYACFVADKPENVKEKFYTGLITQYPVVMNKSIKHFLIINDTYCFKKMYVLPNLVKIIEKFEIEENNNTLFEGFISYENHILEFMENLLQTGPEISISLSYSTFVSVVELGFLTLHSHYFLYVAHNLNQHIVPMDHKAIQNYKELCQADMFETQKESFIQLGNDILQEKQNIEKYILLQEKVDFDV